MTRVRFLVNDSLWRELQAGARRAVPVRAAVAYVGQGGAKLLPLKRGDELVVDMSLPTVRHGATDPKEIRTLIRRGVRVWTRESLHAKFFVMGRAVLAGSANISNNAYKRLDEAGLLTTDPVAVRQALAAFAKMRTEPVRPKYLAKCIDEYQPPKFKGGPPSGKRGRRADVRAKLWFLSRVTPLDPSDADQKLIEQADKRLKKRLALPDATELEWVQFAKPPAFWKNIQPGDWLIHRTTPNGARATVGPPQQVLEFDTVASTRGKMQQRVVFESLPSSKDMPWSTFQRRVAGVAPKLAGGRPRSGPITDEAVADLILGLWTAAGRVARREQRKQ